MANDNTGKPHGQKRKWQDHSLKHGSRGSKKRDMGRKTLNREDFDRRKDVDDRKAKREQSQKNGKESVLPLPFSQEEIEKEERRPKHKVAVLIGYSGTGYRGMQINTDERTIEGDLFSAFVAAGAISKANANDPKKSQLVRCARTDKGVHAAGNVISLKLIVEDEDVVEKINSHLSPQIRVWGIQRTTSSFSSYMACDSRRYEYLIPTHSFLPPHPNSWLAKKLSEIADENGDRKAYDERQSEVAGFWNTVEKEQIQPILDGLEDDIKDEILKALYEVDLDRNSPHYDTEEVKQQLFEAEDADFQVDETIDEQLPPNASSIHKTDDAIDVVDGEQQVHSEISAKIGQELNGAKGGTEMKDTNESLIESEAEPTASGKDTTDENVPASVIRKRRIDAALRTLRRTYQIAKRTYRIDPARLARIQPLLNEFLGTNNFHNYTIQKSFEDRSAQRHIKSFVVHSDPIVINGTEWLSLKIHGQSFMMHQIRKMVAMLALVVRCGCDPARIRQTFANVDVSIPKAPALGLLLERPVFETYNSGPAAKFSRDPIDFAKHEVAIEAFKRREIYERQFLEEEEGNQFHQFFAHTDNLRDPQLLYLSSGGFEAMKRETGKIEEGKARKVTGKVEGPTDGDGVGGSISVGSEAHADGVTSTDAIQET